jgi:hypothetical protein
MYIILNFVSYFDSLLVNNYCIFANFIIYIIRHVPHVEAGSNTSTVTLRVIGGDEKESLKSETVKYGPKSQGNRTRERLRWQGPAAHTKDRPVLSSERAHHENKNVTVRRIPYSEQK